MIKALIKFKISQNNIFKPITLKKKSISGISFGKRCIGHRGNGIKNLYRFVDFFRFISFVPGYIIDINYDPNRNRLLHLISYLNGIISYNLAVDNLFIGDTIENYNTNYKKFGNSYFIYNLTIGSFINSVELFKNKGSKLAKSAGSGIRIFGFYSKYCVLKLPSKIKIRILANCSCILGLSKTQKSSYLIFKAGTKRLKGFRPSVRGVAKNPVDHPLGGGEGKSTGGRFSVNFKGNLLKG